MTFFSFLHAADLHLDSPFAGITDQSGEVAETLRAATFEAFEAFLRLAEKKKPLFVVLAGDVYDGADRSLRAQLFFRNGLARLADNGIRSFVVHGNHDALDGWSSALTWPEAVHIFGADQVETVTVEQNGRPIASVSGISYGRRRENRNLAELYEAANDGLFRIALLHCNCGGNVDHEAYAPCRLSDLLDKGFDYWALGHVHRYTRLNESPPVVYPGTSQGRNIRETGPRGCCLVHVTETETVEIEFRELDSVRWATQQVSIEGLDTMDALENQIRRALEQAAAGAEGRPALCRLTLEGRGPLYHDLRRENTLIDLRDTVRETFVIERPFVRLESIVNRCRPDIDLVRRAQQGDLPAEVLTAAEALLNDTDPRERLAPALKALTGHRGAAKALEEFPTETELWELVDDARWLCLDLLEGSE